MKRIVIEPVDPAPKRPSDMSESVWARLSNSRKAAWNKAVEDVKKKGPVECDYVTGIESVRLSKGLYRIRPEEAAPVEVPTFTEASIGQMGRVGLLGVAATLGVVIEDPKIKTDDLRQAVLERFHEFAGADDDDEE